MNHDLAEKKLGFDDVMIVPEPTDWESRSHISPYSFQVKSNNFVPVVCANMDTTGTIEQAKALKKEGLMCALHKHYETKPLIEHLSKSEHDNTFYSLGISDGELNQFAYIYDQLPDYAKNLLVNIDVANGYMVKFVNFVRDFRLAFPRTKIMAGTVCTPDGVKSLILAGANIVRIGIGGGSQCLTSNKAGIGYPPISMILECRAIIDNHPDYPIRYLCLDGGIRGPSDICKAMVAGADLVMCGGLFAGTAECAGTWRKTHYLAPDDDKVGYGMGLYDINERSLLFYGMSSQTANIKYNGGLKHYRAAEGKETWVKYKGPVSEICKEIKGSLASCCTYTNSLGVSDLRNKKLIRV